MFELTTWILFISVVAGSGFWSLSNAIIYTPPDYIVVRPLNKTQAEVRYPDGTIKIIDVYKLKNKE
jgi:hypothetical protein